MPENAARILVVEDEADMARILQFNLAEKGYEVIVTSDGRSAVETALNRPPSLIMLDLRLPDMTGFEVLAALKADARTAAAPVIIVSAIGDEEAVVEGLNAGAEDYVTKPFRLHELMARVAAAVRRHGARDAGGGGIIVAGPLHVDTASRTVTVDGTAVELTRTEFDILAHFAAHPDKVFTRRRLCNQVLEAEGSVQERTIDAHIRTIRRKLGTRGRCIGTVWGIGYKFSEV